jgi:hypothetical protein
MPPGLFAVREFTLCVSMPLANFRENGKALFSCIYQKTGANLTSGKFTCMKGG